MRNWYDILGMPEGLDPAELSAELDRYEAIARKEHHSDRHETKPSHVREWHAKQLRMCLEGVDFLRNPRRRAQLDDYLRRQRAATEAADKAAAAAAQAEAVRKHNVEEARQRGDADDLRAGFGNIRSSPGAMGSTASSSQSNAVPPNVPSSSPRKRQIFEPIDDGEWGLVAVLGGVYAGVLSILVSLLASKGIIPNLTGINPLIYIFPLSFLFAYLTVSLGD